MEGLETQNVLGIILGGGRGNRLFPLTQYRSKPAVPIGGKYRLIDVPISNCLHSDINQLFVLTQFNSASLHRHISQTYRFDHFSNGYVEILAAEQTQEHANWYQGTADAVRKQLRHILSRRADYCLILSGDHLYHMDYRTFLLDHWARRADVSIAVKPVRREEASELGILKVDSNRRIVKFVEKPQSDQQLDELRLAQPPGEDPEALYLASMGIYLFNPQVLTSLLLGNDQEDFGKHIIPEAIEKLSVYGHFFEGIWEDIGNVSTFYQANLALAEPDPAFTFDRPATPVYTHPRYLAGARIETCQIESSIIAEGCQLKASSITHSVIGIRSFIGQQARISETIVMGADFYEKLDALERNHSQNLPPVGIGDRSRIHRAIIDKNARIGRDVVICNQEGVRETDGDNYFIRDGIVIIPKDAIIADGRVI